MSKVALAALLALVFTIPVECAVVFEGYVTLSRIIGYLALAAGILAVLAEGRFRRLPLIQAFFGAYVLWTFLSLLWSDFPEDTLVRVLTFVRLWGMTWLVWQFAPTPASQRSVMYAYLAGGCVSMATQFLAIERGFGYRFTGGALNLNDFACLIALSIPMSIYLATSPATRSRIVRIGCWGFTAAAVFSVLMTGSRTGIIVGCLCSALMFLGQFRFRPVAVLGVAAAGTLAVLLFYRVAPIETVDRLTGTPEALSGDWTLRRQIQAAALERYADHPFLGTGSGTFPLIIGAIERERGPAVYELAAHNAYLDVLVETGAVGLALFAAILVCALVYALKMRGYERLLWLALLAGWGLGAVALSWDYVKITWLLLGLVASGFGTYREGLAGKSRETKIRNPAAPGRVGQVPGILWNRGG